MVDGKIMSNYLKFLMMKQTIEDEFCTKYGLDLRSLSLLDEIWIAIHTEQPLITTKLMMLSKHGAPSTIHRSLRILKDASLVFDFHQGLNRRTKYLGLSQFCEDYYAELSGLIFKFKNQ